MVTPRGVPYGVLRPLLIVLYGTKPVQVGKNDAEKFDSFYMPIVLTAECLKNVIYCINNTLIAFTYQRLHDQLHDTTLLPRGMPHTSPRHCASGDTPVSRSSATVGASGL